MIHDTKMKSHRIISKKSIISIAFLIFSRSLLHEIGELQTAH